MVTRYCVSIQYYQGHEIDLPIQRKTNVICTDNEYDLRIPTIVGRRGKALHHTQSGGNPKNCRSVRKDIYLDQVKRVAALLYCCVSPFPRKRVNGITNEQIFTEIIELVQYFKTATYTECGW